MSPGDDKRESRYDDAEAVEFYAEEANRTGDPVHRPTSTTSEASAEEQNGPWSAWMRSCSSASAMPPRPMIGTSARGSVPLRSARSSRPRKPPAPGDLVDLMERLDQSVRAAREAMAADESASRSAGSGGTGRRVPGCCIGSLGGRRQERREAHGGAHGSDVRRAGRVWRAGGRGRNRPRRPDRPGPDPGTRPGRCRGDRPGPRRRRYRVWQARPRTGRPSVGTTATRIDASWLRRMRSSPPATAGTWHRFRANPGQS